MSMYQRIFFLIISVSSVISVHIVKSRFTVLFDNTDCINLRCYWTGEGNDCDEPQRATKGIKMFHLKFINDNDDSLEQLKGSLKFLNATESDADFLKRLRKSYPFNTFTMNKYQNIGKLCKKKGVWCDIQFGLNFWSEEYFLDEILKEYNPANFEC